MPVARIASSIWSYRLSKKSKKDKPSKKLKAVTSLDPTTERIQALGNYLSNISSYSDVGSAFTAMDMLKKEIGSSALLDKAGGFNTFGVQDPFGYSPQGSSFRNLFPNPFGIFAYLADKYAPVRMCRVKYKKEIKSDGTYLVGDENAFKSTLEIIKKYDLNDLIQRMCDHSMTFGNYWIWPIKTLLGGIKEFRLLEPQFISPIMDNKSRTIIGWAYDTGWGYLRFRLDELIHGIQDPSMACPQLGSPRLGSLLVDIEADIAASMFNNTVFQKGGLVGIAILMDPSKSNPVPGAGGVNNFAALMEAKLNSNKAGARGGYGYAVLEGAKDVKRLNDLEKLDGAFKGTNQRVKKDVALLMGCSPADVGETLNTAGVYSALGLEDSAALQWDKSVNEVVAEALETVNENLLPLLKVLNVRMAHHKRYNALTRTATQSLLDLSQIDGIMSIDEGRVEFLKRPAFGGIAGAMPLRRIPNVSATAEGIPAVSPVPIPAEEQNDYQ